jgi:hypothetical protein
MGIMDKVNQIAGGGKSNASVQLSSTGDDKLTKIHAGGAEWMILSAVKRHEPCTVDEVSRDQQLIKFSHNQIKDTMQSLLDRGWLMFAPIGGR